MARAAATSWPAGIPRTRPRQTAWNEPEPLAEISDGDGHGALPLGRPISRSGRAFPRRRLLRTAYADFSSRLATRFRRVSIPINSSKRQPRQHDARGVGRFGMKALDSIVNEQRGRLGPAEDVARDDQGTAELAERAGDGRSDAVGQAPADSTGASSARSSPPSPGSRGSGPPPPGRPRTRGGPARPRVRRTGRSRTSSPAASPARRRRPGCPPLRATGRARRSGRRPAPASTARR